MTTLQREVDLGQAGESLRELRQKKGWSRPELARRSEVSEATIRNLENVYRPDGRPSRPYGQTAVKLAQAFGLPDGIRILKIFGYESLVDDVFPPEAPEVKDLSGLTSRQEEMISRIVERLVDGLVELARSGSERPVVDLSRYRNRGKGDYVSSPLAPLAPVVGL